MKTLSFYDYEDFAHDIDEKYDSLTCDDKSITVIAKYEEARQIIKELICIGYNIRSIASLEEPDFGDYCDEYIVSVSNIDEEYEIWCEPMKRDGKYIWNESDVTYVMNNCSSKIIEYCEADSMYEVEIEVENINEDTSDYGCNGCDTDGHTYCYRVPLDQLDKVKRTVEYSKGQGDDIHGFTVSRSDGDSYISYSCYSTDKLSEKDIQGLIQEIGI